MSLLEAAGGSAGKSSEHKAVIKSALMVLSVSFMMVERGVEQCWFSGS